MWHGRQARKHAGLHAVGRLVLAAVLLAALLTWQGMLKPGPGRTMQLQLTAADVAAGTPTHGRLVKHGPFPALLELAAGRGMAELSYRPDGAWAAQRLRGGVPPLPSKWCAVLVNHKYRIIYLKCPKTASTSLVDHFGNCEYDSRDTCLAYVNFENVTEVQHVASRWQDYFVFGFSRNILARAVSQYRYLTHFMHGCPRVPWIEFCGDPLVLGDVCRRAEDAGQPCCQQSPEHQYVHVLPQAHCFTTAANESAVDWLGRVEHFEQDLAALVLLLNSRPGVPPLQLPAKVGETNVEKQAPCQAQSHRRLAYPTALTIAQGTLNPCKPADYFRGTHARCHGEVLRVFTEDVSFLYTRQPRFSDS